MMCCKQSQRFQPSAFPNMSHKSLWNLADTFLDSVKTAKFPRNYFIS